MILTGDYHTHTPYSHGKGSVNENAARAKELGLKQIAITDHGFSHVAFGLRHYRLENYIKDCQEASKKHQIDVLVGIESNILGADGGADLQEKDYEKFDVYLCGNHIFIWYDSIKDWWNYGLGNIAERKLKKEYSSALIENNTKAYINTIKKNPIDILTHLNYLCPCDTLEVAKCAADYGTYIELSAKKRHLSDEQLTEILEKTDARFVINSDAHTSDRVGDSKIVEEQLQRLQLPMDRIDNIDGKYPQFRFAEFKKHL